MGLGLDERDFVNLGFKMGREVVLVGGFVLFIDFLDERGAGSVRARGGDV